MTAATPMMIHKCNILSLSDVKKPVGSVLNNWNATLSNVPCNVEKAKDETVVLYGRLGTTSLIYVHFDQELNLTNRNAIEWNSLTYEVVGVDNVANQNVVWKVSALYKQA